MSTSPKSNYVEKRAGTITQGRDELNAGKDESCSASIAREEKEAELKNKLCEKFERKRVTTQHKHQQELATMIHREEQH